MRDTPFVTRVVTHITSLDCELMVRISHQPTQPTIALRQNPKGEKILHNSHVRLSYLAGFLFPLTVIEIFLFN